MKTLKLTTRIIAIASLTLTCSYSIAQAVSNDDLQNGDYQINCQDKYGNMINGTPSWASYPGKIVTISACPTNAKVGIQVMNPEANLHISSGLSKTADANIMLVENNHQKVLKLTNAGVLYAREIRVNLDAWPDYVFEDKYDLISLDSLENYIAQEGHLPNVPAADSIISGGLDLGASNKLLMEKVEELTLYLIAQNKEQAQLKATLEEQQKVLKAQQELLVQQTLIIQQISANLK
ncbi:hypothetical protein SAMN05216474_2663 [Lishizhenia tianjinensis]|uniref:Secreted protein n=1 Tax=Lishizhenia tianjinensis TaxID=477690 RepID=A0A1I7BC46_9FLAO|nr:hypothetical protein [Lishizhenia tianjinensis]SFT84711.1 hypothetical protein SAMN05216474_2663 [Lishizhenia tianjinensis]